MYAVLCTDFEESTVGEVETPTPGPGEVRIDVSRVQLSVTECLLYRGADTAHADEIARRLRETDSGTQLFGHEFCGTVAAVGDGVTGFAVGDRVYAPGKIRCGECAYCRSGHGHLCADVVSFGYDLPGALAESVVLPEEPLCRLPDGVSDAEGAAMQPMASSVLCALDAGIEAGDTVLVVGGGVMGFQCAMLAKRFGAGEAFVSDVRDAPLGVVDDHGLTPIDARTDDPATVVRDATDGVGADVVFEAVGGSLDHATDGNGPVATAFDAVRRGGTVLQVSHVEGDVPITPRLLRSKSVRWVNPRKGVIDVTPDTNTGELAASLVASGDVPIGEYVTHELDGLASFEEAVAITLEKGEYGALGPAQMVLE